MQQSQEINALASALSGFQAEIPKIPFNAKVSYKLRTGGSKEFAYADLNQLWTTIRPLLKKYELSVIQALDKTESEDTVITTQVMHSSGQWIRSHAHYGAQGSPQDQGSYITYIKRYSLAASLGLVGEEDDDGQGAAETEAQAKTSQKEAKQEEEVKQGKITFQYFIGQVGRIDNVPELDKLYAAFTEQGKASVSQQKAADMAYKKHKEVLSKRSEVDNANS